MTEASAAPPQVRAIRLWLVAIAALIAAMVLVGGATRLTESGLSIVEWQPVTGTVPPLSDAQWQVEFDKYRATPQYQHLNAGMRLGEFKTLFWWEWAHRLLGRVIGAAFLLPFLFFLWRGWVTPQLRLRLWTIFALGGLQGAVGWWMVASGLVNRVEVSQYRLATHLVLACAIYVAIVWTLRSLSPREAAAVPARLRLSAAGVLAVALVQIYLGALVAGLRAGLIYNTWPLIDGSFVPGAADLFATVPAWRNFFENALTVQFDHRMLAYALWVLAVLHVIDAARLRNAAALNGALTLAVAVTIQAVLGILTLIYVAPLGLALMHQAMAIAVLTIAVVHAQRLAPPARERHPAVFAPPLTGEDRVGANAQVQGRGSPA
ncbi:MAG: COX15/CtaA family protein [Bradyrhizobiaceae bacterium]|nr:COX15/CtaA family protein [Hyphomicrobiales bacterium]MBV9426532.1 COX15/CtaA family protein [Bradyrhizobiaceae bacterium]